MECASALPAGAAPGNLETVPCPGVPNQNQLQPHCRLEEPPRSHKGERWEKVSFLNLPFSHMDEERLPAELWGRVISPLIPPVRLPHCPSSPLRSCSGAVGHRQVSRSPVGSPMGGPCGFPPPRPLGGVFTEPGFSLTGFPDLHIVILTGWFWGGLGGGGGCPAHP